MHQAVAAIDVLYSTYLKANKKRATIDLVVSSVPSQIKSRDCALDPADVRIRYQVGQEKEVDWFVTATR